MSSSRSSAALRLLLRGIQQHLSASGNPMWRDYVVSEFRKHAGTTDPQVREQLVAKAEAYARLLSAVHMHKSTLMSYNISIGADQGQAEQIRRTAAKVGFSMPKMAEP
mmetsp:Transcript_19451/g.48924  ORF Transcript_19451/g.48924 Transcript_19451/m.48924 type:complete len:108 (+) Transcript_19451:132-455(+)|eukprot:jgi/Tetstr1/420382/TSEL_011498.t1